MTTVILVIHIMICVAMVALILLQKSEGGALGIGGGGGSGGGFMSGRGTANLLSRATAMLAVGFFATSITLTMLAQRTGAPASILDGSNSSGQTQSGQTGNNSSGSNLPELKPAAPKLPTGPQVPKSQ